MIRVWRLQRGRFMYVALNKVCVTHASRGQRQPQQTLLFTSKPVNYFSKTMSHVSLWQVRDGPVLWRAIMASGCGTESQPSISDTKPSLEVTGSVVWLRICTCCQLRVLLRARQKRGLGLQTRRGWKQEQMCNFCTFLLYCYWTLLLHTMVWKL